MGLGAFELLIVVAVLAIVAILVIALAATGAIGAVAMATTDAESQGEGSEWAGTWQGHELVLQTQSGQHSLYIDGRLVAQQTTDAGATLEGRIDTTPVIGSIQKGSGVNASLHVDGVAVPVQRRPFGTAMSTGGSTRQISTGAKEPTDPRWAAILKLVDQVQTQGGEASALAGRSKAELQTLLLKIAEAEEANASHQQLAGREDERLRRLIDQHEAQVGRLIDALRELHVGTVEHGRSPDESARLLAALEVELAQRQKS